MKKVFISVALLLLLLACDSKTPKEVSFFETLKEKIGTQAMVLEIGSSSCRSCIKMKKMIEQLKQEDSSLPIYIIDVYDDMNVFREFNIQLIPTQIVLNKEGKEVHRHVGAIDADEMLQFVELSKK